MVVRTCRGRVKSRRMQPPHLSLKGALDQSGCCSKQKDSTTHHVRTSSQKQPAVQSIALLEGETTAVHHWDGQRSTTHLNMRSIKALLPTPLSPTKMTCRACTIRALSMHARRIVGHRCCCRCTASWPVALRPLLACQALQVRFLRPQHAQCACMHACMHRIGLSTLSSVSGPSSSESDAMLCSNQQLPRPNEIRLAVRVGMRRQAFCNDSWQPQSNPRHPAPRVGPKEQSWK